MALVGQFLLNLFIFSIPILIVSLLIWGVVCWIAGCLHKGVPSKKTFAILALAIGCCGFCFAWTYDGTVLDATEQSYQDALVEKEMATDAKNGYKSYVELADKIIAELEPYANDEQQQMIDDYRDQKTRTIDEVYDEFKDYTDDVEDYANQLGNDASRMIEEQNNSGQQ